jgi:topoisomerase-4 subunit B
LAFRSQLVLSGNKGSKCLINYFRVESVRDEKQKAAEFSAGNLMLEEDVLFTKRKGLLSFRMKPF